MQLKQVIELIDRKRDETSDFLVKNCPEDCPADYYKAQGMNEIYCSAAVNVENVKIGYVSKNLEAMISALIDFDRISDIQRQQGKIEALRFILSLMEERK